MLLVTLTLSVSMIAFSMFLASNPITIGVMILMMALLLAITFAYSLSSWMAFLIFLIYIGGMLVMFSYFVSIIPNQNISFLYNLSMMLITFSLMLLTSNIMSMKPSMMSSYTLQLNIMYLPSNAITLIMLASVLLFTMIVVVKLTTITKGPLRPFNAYV